ncbi:MAG: hydroxyacylglutathione hydrolase, partial [Chitinivibrionales bacterium]|nr:hydroxyacylglutathione hydrolase [Chitinivibrionales bacterium]
CPVAGFERAGIAEIDMPVCDKQEFTLDGLSVAAMHVPGHTQDHMAWYLPDHDVVFTGDSLFAGGCGRLFDGSAGQMWGSLVSLMRLPDTTDIYCGHEYTVENLQFALSLEPDNARVGDRLEHAIARRKERRSTLPPTLGLEKATNPFLRAGDPALRRALRMSDASDEAVFARIRKQKDRY